jgi:2-oxoglutarate ferredoxin oxidoreductase subunit alpha
VSQSKRILCDGSEAIARAAIAAGIRFYSGYPMAPSTDLLEALSRQMPAAGGVCMNASSEIEAVNMAMGAAMTGFRAAAGSCGQGVSLMQEAIAECGLHQTPLVIFNISRMQQDYFQATRGGGWGDYRTIALAPKDVQEAFKLTQDIFYLTDKYRMPGMLLAEGMLVRTQVGIDTTPNEYPPLPPKDWALDGTTSGTGKSKNYWTWNLGKHGNPGPGPELHWRTLAEKHELVAQTECRFEQGFVEDAEIVVVAFGTAANFAEYAVREMRREGRKVGFFRPITLWPFPSDALEKATRSARIVAVFEINAGQMIDDVRLSVEGRHRVRAIGDISSDMSGMNMGTLLDAPVVRERIEALFEGVPA